MRTIEPCCSSAIHHAWRLHSRLHLGQKCRLEKVALVVRRSEAAGWRWSSSTLNECKPRFLGVAVMHWARPMATELRDSRSGRRQGSSSDWRVPYGALHTLRRSNYENPSALISGVCGVLLVSVFFVLSAYHRGTGWELLSPGAPSRVSRRPEHPRPTARLSLSPYPSSARYETHPRHRPRLPSPRGLAVCFR